MARDKMARELASRPEQVGASPVRPSSRFRAHQSPGGHVHGCPGTFMAAGSHLFPTTRTDGATAPLSSSAPDCIAQATSTKKAMRPRQEEGGGGGGAEKAMSGTGAVSGAIAGAAPTMECYFCGGAPAVVYCRADAAGLCLPCDRHVHGANTVSCRHARSPLCAVCRAAAATVRRGAARFLCSNCDFEEQQHGAPTEPPVLLHDRGTVEGYTGCPSVGELAAILGVGVGDGDKVWWPVWEEPQVLTYDDVIVPTTSCHGLQPLLTSSSSPKNRRPPCGELDGEVLRQLGDLAKSEEAATTEPACVDQLPPWGSSDYVAIGHADLGALGAEAICAAAILHVPPSQHQEAWIAVDCNEAPERASAGSSAEPSLSSFVEVSEVCPGLSRSGSSADEDHPSPPPAAAPVAVQAQAPPAQASKNVGGYDVVYPDRDKVISRYKEKRKNRMFGKQIRYESRKARADGRVRINGRFAKSS